MERFCHNCGSLVSGEGVFCPQCGGRLDAFDLGSNEGTSSAQTENTANTEAVSTTGTGVNLQKPAAEAEQTSTSAVPAAPVSTTGYTNSTYSYNPNNTAPYVNPSNATVQPEEMTTGQWVLTLFLGSLGIIGIVLLFVWGFSDSTPTSKKNFSRAMLIWYAIGFGLCLLIWMIGAACAISIPFMFANY